MPQSESAPANKLCCVLHPYLGCTICEWVICLECRGQGVSNAYGQHRRIDKCKGELLLLYFKL